MSNQVVSIIGSGQQSFRKGHEGQRHNLSDLSFITNFEDMSAVHALSGSIIAVPSTAAVLLPSNPLPSRRAIAIYNTGGGPIMVAGTSGNAVSAGFPINPGQAQSYQASALINIWAIASGVDSQANILEIA